MTRFLCRYASHGDHLCRSRAAAACGTTSTPCRMDSNFAASRVVNIVTPAPCGEAPAAGLLMDLGRAGRGRRKEEPAAGLGSALRRIAGRKVAAETISETRYPHHRRAVLQDPISTEKDSRNCVRVEPIWTLSRNKTLHRPSAGTRSDRQLSAQSLLCN